MRQLLLIIFILLCYSNLKSQALIGTSGNNITNSNITIEYAIGEVSTTTLQSGSSYFALTQGLLQPYITMAAPVIKPFQIPNVFSPNGDNINDVWDITGIQVYANCRV